MPAAFLLQMAGPSGAGKSTLAREIARATGAVIIDIDVIKSAVLDAGVTWDLSGRTAYRTASSLADSLLVQGESVILDSPSRFAFIVDEGMAVADAHGVPYAFIECLLSDEIERRQRLQNRVPHRSQRPDVDTAPADASKSPPVVRSSAHETVYPEIPWLQVDMQAEVEENVEAALEYLKNLVTDSEGVTSVNVFPAQSTVLDERVLRARILPAYDIPEVESCRFLERGAGDIYRVLTSGGAYYLKIYRPPQLLEHTQGEALFVAALAEAGLPVVRAVLLMEGGYARAVRASEGLRPMLLFEEAPPPLPAERTPEMLAELGKLVAGVHQVVDGFEDEFALPKMEPAVCLEGDVRHIRRFLGSEDRQFLGEVAVALAAFLSAQPRTAPDYGLCHNDLVLSNVRMETDGPITLMDFGNAQFTWRGLELAVIYWSLRGEPELQAPLWEAFLQGYAEWLELPDLVVTHLPSMLLMRQISFMGANCQHLPLRLGTEPIESGFIEREMNTLRGYAEDAGI